MTRVEWNTLSSEIDNKPEWNKELYKHRKYDFSKVVWRVIYNDGSHVDGPQGYDKLKRKDVKSISAVLDGKILHTVQVKDNFFVIRIRNLVRGLVGENSEFGWRTPKRVVVLATKGNIAYVWDDGDIDELQDFGDQEPYTKPKLMDSEK